MGGQKKEKKKGRRNKDERKIEKGMEKENKISNICKLSGLYLLKVCRGPRTLAEPRAPQ